MLQNYFHKWFCSTLFIYKEKISIPVIVFNNRIYSIILVISNHTYFIILLFQEGSHYICNTHTLQMCINKRFYRIRQKMDKMIQYS